MKTTHSFQSVQPHLIQIMALAQHLDIEYFQYEDAFYIGASQETFDAKEEALLIDPDYDSREEIDSALKSWIDEKGFSLLEDEFSISSYDNVVEYGSEEYLVVDDSEADSLWDASLESYLQDCVYPELPSNMRGYFDEEKWKNDARMDGRGHSLATYDGNENEETVEGETYYIYRIN